MKIEIDEGRMNASELRVCIMCLLVMLDVAEKFEREDAAKELKAGQSLKGYVEAAKAKMAAES